MTGGGTNPHPGLPVFRLFLGYFNRYMMGLRVLHESHQ
jgi:hypothetical protein